MGHGNEGYIRASSSLPRSRPYNMVAKNIYNSLYNTNTCPECQLKMLKSCYNAECLSLKLCNTIDHIAYSVVNPQNPRRLIVRKNQLPG